MSTSFVPPTVAMPSPCSQYVVRPTRRSPAPSAITLCVSLGTSDTMRCGGCMNTSARPRSSVTLSAGTGVVYHTCYLPSVADLPNADDAFDASKQDAIAEAIKNLSREEAALFLFHLESKYQKRKLQLTGYLAAMLLWIAGMLFAIY